MGKLIDKIERVQKASGPRLGFAPPSASKQSSILLMAIVSSGAIAESVAGKGADALLVKGGSAPRVSSSVPVGGPLGAGRGDFALADLSSSPLLLVGSDEQDVVLTLALDLPDVQVRFLEALPVDAFLLPLDDEPFTMQRLMQYVRITRATNKPVLATVAADVESAQLRVLRDSGVAGFAVEVSETGGVEGVARLRLALDGLPSRKMRGSRSGGVASVGAAIGLAGSMPDRRAPTPDPDEDDEP